MSTESKTVELEVVEDQKLVKYANQTGLEKPATSALVAAFHPIFDKARKAIADAQGVAESVKDATCVKEIRKSRACRLALREVRIESDKVRKKQKEHALLFGKAVDGFHNILLADLSPVETALQDAEDIAERAEATRLAALKAAREAELQPFLETPVIGDLSTLSEREYAQTLSDAKLLKQAKIDAAAKAEADAKARAEGERLERERIAAENAKLKAEAEAREAAAKAEREEAARKLAAEQAAAKAAQDAANKKLAEEREAAEAARKAAEARARKEREAIEAKAKAEREAAEAEAKKEQARLKAIADEERAKVAAAEAAAQALRDAESKKAALAAAAAKKAAAAPDNAKAQAFADSLRDMPLPSFTGSTFALLPQKVEALAKWVESQITTGELI
jgi:colicin import membrane protein